MKRLPNSSILANPKAVSNDDLDKNVVDVTWMVDPTKNKVKKEELGKYFIRTSLDMKDEVFVWNAYSTIKIKICSTQTEIPKTRNPESTGYWVGVVRNVG